LGQISNPALLGKLEFLDHRSDAITYPAELATLEKNAIPELQTHSFGNSASPFPTFLHLLAPFQT
jgi:hypothetical protein